MDLAVEASALRKVWPARGAPVVAVADLDLGIPRGSIFGLLGPNGAGKSTTMRMIASLLPPTSGTVLVDGMDAARSPHAVRRRIGYLSATSGLPARLTCREILTLFAELQEVEAVVPAVERAIATFDITDFADRYVTELSTGMRQRVRIAVATVHTPSLLILDEPTAGLDVVASRQLLDAIRAVRDAGATVLFSTHELGKAEQLCDEIAVIASGRLRGRGRTEELIAIARQSDPAVRSLEDAFLQLVV